MSVEKTGDEIGISTFLGEESGVEDSLDHLANPDNEQYLKMT